MECNTVGELREFLKRFPDDKPLILDIKGNTYPVVIDNWDEADDCDTDYPVAIFT